ncbi:MAG: mechanosensitive ion channel family protein [Gammaproteobacteria bacterium]|nr:mechanosensitive ion channel family protein [Gammaproteobacteria bacterium]
MGQHLHHLLDAAARLLAANSLRDWITAAGIAIVTWTLLLLVRRVAARRLHHGAVDARPLPLRLLGELIAHTRAFFLAGIAISVGQEGLALPETLRGGIGRAVLLLGLLQTGLWAGRAVRFYLAQQREQRGGDRVFTGSLDIIHFVARLLIWSLLVLVALDNLGVNITALLAGLGVGGVAVALALQNVLGDLFASLSIALDKPFVVGDSLTVDALSGQVEHIGIKTTRLRSDSGEQIVISNADLLKSRIRNFTRAAELRSLATIRVAYDTPAATLREIPGILKSIVDAQPHARFERCHLKTLGDWALIYELSYFRRNPTAYPLLDLQQAVNLAILEEFARRGIRIASPPAAVAVV